MHLKQAVICSKQFGKPLEDDFSLHSTLGWEGEMTQILVSFPTQVMSEWKELSVVLAGETLPCSEVLCEVLPFSACCHLPLGLLCALIWSKQFDSHCWILQNLAKLTLAGDPSSPGH